MRALPDGNALVADPARLGGGTVLAVHHLREDARGRGLPRSPRPAEEERVRQPLLANGPHQRADDVLRGVPGPCVPRAGIGPARADCGYRAPLAPHPARPPRPSIPARSDGSVGAPALADFGNARPRSRVHEARWNTTRHAARPRGGALGRQRSQMATMPVVATNALNPQTHKDVTGRTGGISPAGTPPSI